MQAHDGRPFPLPPGASNLRGHKAARGRIRRLANRVGQREHGQKKQLMFSRKLSNPKPNKKRITRSPNFLLSLDHYVTTPLYIYMLCECPEK